MAEFIIPAFLSNSSAADIHGRILANIPAKFDKTEGGIVWDMTYANAMEIAETVEFALVELIKSMFPMWAEGQMLDYHGQNRGLIRRSAVRAKGTVVICGTAGHVIPAGTLLSTTSDDDDDETILFVTLEDGEISNDTTVEVAIEAVDVGAAGNVAAGRINRLDVTDADVLSLANQVATSGGLDTEDDESYRARLIEYDAAQGESFIGTYADYKRWALSVNGVGGAVVLQADDSSGTVRIIVKDTDGNPASDELCRAVYDYIMRPDNPSQRLAPINAVLRVDSTEARLVTIAANVETDGIRDIESIKNDFMDRLKEYYEKAIEEKEIKYSKICALLIDIDGVSDYNNVQINGGTSNITVDIDELPYSDADSVTLTIAE